MTKASSRRMIAVLLVVACPVVLISCSNESGDFLMIIGMALCSYAGAFSSSSSGNGSQWMSLMGTGLQTMGSTRYGDDYYGNDGYTYRVGSDGYLYDETGRRAAYEDRQKATVRGGSHMSAAQRERLNNPSATHSSGFR